MTIIQYKESGKTHSAETLNAETAESQLKHCIDVETDIIRKADCANKLGLIYSEGFIGKTSYKEAIKYYRIAYELVPNDIIYSHNLGLAYYNAKSYKKAEPLLKRCVKSSANELEDYNRVTCASKLGPMYGEGWLGTKNLEEAVAYYKIANKLEPDNSSYASNLAHYANSLGVAYEKGRQGQKVDLSKALEYYELAHTLSPDTITYNNNLADVYYQLGQYEQAMDLYKNCLDAELTSSFSNINKANCANTLSAIYRAKGTSILSSRNKADYDYSISALLFDEAIKNAIKAHELAPADSAYTHNLAINYFDSGAYRKANTLFKLCAKGKLTEHFTETIKDGCIEGVKLSGEKLGEL